MGFLLVYLSRAVVSFPLTLLSSCKRVLLKETVSVWIHASSRMTLEASTLRSIKHNSDVPICESRSEHICGDKYMPLFLILVK